MTKTHQFSNLGAVSTFLESLNDCFGTMLLATFLTFYIFNLVTFLIVEPIVKCLAGSMTLFANWMLLIGYNSGLINDDTLSGKSIIDLDDLSASMKTADHLLSTLIYDPVLAWQVSIITWLCSSGATSMSSVYRSVVQTSNAAVESDQIMSSVESSRTSMCSCDPGHQETTSSLFQTLFGSCQ